MSKAKTPKEVLIATKWIFENKLDWHQGYFWKDKNGLRLNTKDKAVSCCLVGCIAFIEADSEPIFEARKILHDIVSCNLANWNDDTDRTKQDVLNLLQKASDSIKD